ncbi:hypothetical protein BASA61_004277 [Batrachochytrium salamandrivorans]|nr:hypothetical protein BASA61_004277 [Batrachochytrium salamandrivorans]
MHHKLSVHQQHSIALNSTNAAYLVLSRLYSDLIRLSLVHLYVFNQQQPIMKFHAFSLIAMFMVTANALTGSMDSMDDASGLVKRQDSDPFSTPTDDSILNCAPVFSASL